MGTAVFQRALAHQADEQGQVTSEMIERAEWIAGIELTAPQRETMKKRLAALLADYEALREVRLDRMVAPALHFTAEAGTVVPLAAPANRKVGVAFDAEKLRPPGEEDLAYLPVADLARLLRQKKVTSVELTELALRRLKGADGVLRCVVTLTEELAMRQARAADVEIQAGRWRGPLHGIPWGAKDLIAYPGYRTTFGAPQFTSQVLQAKATVAQRMDDAGAVLVAKLSLGALAQGDEWFGGMTRNPWNTEEGASGSSSGSAAAVAAGLLPIAIGSETLGSIISPSTRCGATGLRPTFGRVSRYGCMPLAWSLDKIGPIARSAECCAIVLAAIHGADGLDPTAVDRPFTWPVTKPFAEMTFGYLESEGGPSDREPLRILGDLGMKLTPIRLPEDFPFDAMDLILDVEAATVFDDLLTAGESAGLNRWPSSWRKGAFVTAREYLRTQRIRTRLLEAMRQATQGLDGYLAIDDLVLTNLTGHPQIALPSGFTRRGGADVPVSIVLTGQVFGEDRLLAVAAAWQKATGFHLRRPTLPQPGQPAPPK